LQIADFGFQIEICEVVESGTCDAERRTTEGTSEFPERRQSI